VVTSLLVAAFVVGGQVGITQLIQSNVAIARNAVPPERT